MPSVNGGHSRSLFDRPESWTDARLGLDVDLTGQIRQLLVFHGLICLALRHPIVSPEMVRVGADLLDHLESIFEANGLKPPPQGWRGDAPGGNPS